MSGNIIPMTNRVRTMERIFPATLLTATYQRGSIIKCEGFRFVRLHYKLDSASAATQLSVVPLFSPGIFGAANPDADPAVGDDAWFAPGQFDGTYTDEALPGTLATGSDFTQTPLWRVAKGYPLAIEMPIGTTASDKQRMSIDIDCTGWRWAQFQFADLDAAGTKATLTVTATCHA